MWAEAAYNEVLSLLPKGSSLLDIGSGKGDHASGFRRCFQVTTVDLTHDADFIDLRLIGPALESQIDGKTYGGVFVNFSFGWAPHPRVVVATEQNFEWFPSSYLIRWMPQVHWQIHAHFQWQAGFGIRHLDGQTSGEASTRLIAEF